MIEKNSVSALGQIAETIRWPQMGFFAAIHASAAALLVLH